MNGIKNILILLGFGFFLLQGCYYDVEEELYPSTVNPCNTTNLVYNGEIDKIINQNCALSDCHVSGTGRVDFTTYTGVNKVASDGRLMQNAVVEKSMPPSGPLPDCEIKKIEAWINQGHPEK